MRLAKIKKKGRGGKRETKPPKKQTHTTKKLLNGTLPEKEKEKFSLKQISQIPVLQS